MPDDRFLHPRLGHSAKVSKLTDLEYRVWTQYILSADDRGVMRLSALTIQADNDALAQRPVRVIQRALESLATVNLIMIFDHQGRSYACDPFWQDFQKVKWPRSSKNPIPPEAILAQMSNKTRANFGRTSTLKPSEVVVDHRLTANGSCSSTSEESFDRFWEIYPRKVGKDAARREWQHLAPDNDFANLLIEKVLEHKASTQWSKDGGEFIPHARTWLHQKRWEDVMPKAKHKVGYRPEVEVDDPL